MTTEYTPQPTQQPAAPPATPAPAPQPTAAPSQTAAPAPASVAPQPSLSEPLTIEPSSLNAPAWQLPNDDSASLTPEPQAPANQPHQVPNTDTPEAGSLRQQFASQGIDVSRYTTDEALVSDLVRLQNEAPHLREYAQIGQQLAPHAGQFSEWIAEKQAGGSQQVPQEPEPSSLDKAWQAPAYDPKWESQVRFDEASGSYVGVNNFVPPQVVQGVNEYHQFMRDQAREFFSDNPYKKMWEAQQEPLKDLVRQEFQEMHAREVKRQQITQFEQENAKWIYQADESGQVKVNQVTGTPELTPEGQRFFQVFDYLRSSGMNDEMAAALTAIDQVQGEVAQARLLSGQSPTHDPAALGVQTTPQVPGQPAPAPAATPQQASEQQVGSFLQNAQAFHSPSSSVSAQVPAEPVSFRSQSELDDFFISEARRQLTGAA